MGSVGWIIVIAILFVLVLLNNKRNMKKLKDRRSGNFRENYYKKKRNS